MSRPRSSTAHLLIFLAWIWCAALWAHVPEKAATTALAVTYLLLFIGLLPFNRWACFLVIVAMCGSEIALRAWSPMRYNTVHYATFVLLPVAYVVVRPRLRLPKPAVFWLGMCLWFAVSRLWSTDAAQWLAWTTEYFGVMALALLTRQLCTSPQRRREMGIVFTLTALATLAGVVVISGVGHGGRLGSLPGMNSNGLARLPAMGILMLAMAAAEAGPQRILSPGNVAVYLALGVSLMLTESRGAMLALAGAGLTIALAQPRWSHRLVGLGGCLLLGTVFVLAAVQVDPVGMGRRYQSTFDKGSLSGATAGRSEIARTVAYMLRDNWVAGVGAGQFGNAYRHYSVLAHSLYHNADAAAAHSGYLDIASEGGVVAVLLMLGFYLALWISTAQITQGQRRAMARALIVYMLIDLFSSDGIQKGSWLAVGLLLVWFWESRPYPPFRHPHPPNPRPPRA